MNIVSNIFKEKKRQILVAVLLKNTIELIQEFKKKLKKKSFGEISSVNGEFLGPLS